MNWNIKCCQRLVETFATCAQTHAVMCRCWRAVCWNVSKVILGGELQVWLPVIVFLLVEISYFYCS